MLSGFCAKTTRHIYINYLNIELFPTNELTVKKNEDICVDIKLFILCLH